jgi:ribosome-binding ATPase YchF (GTP1/OBG family)
MATKSREKLLGAARSGQKDAKEVVAFLDGAIEGLNQGLPARKLNLSPTYLGTYRFLTAKPMLYVANVDENDLEGKSPLVQAMREYSDQQGAEIVTLCAKLEAEISQLPEEERAEFLGSLGLKESGLDKLVHAGHKLLKRMAFFTVGPEEARAWDIQIGTTAVQAAGKIHSDIARDFARAQIYTFDDIVKYGTEAALKEKGLMRAEGREYIMRDNDVVHFL